MLPDSTRAAFRSAAIAVACGWHSIFGDRIFAAWIVDYIFAYAFGIVFQYFTIAPMRGLSFGQGIVAAVKADTLSLTAWQIGMCGFMAIAYFLIFRIGFVAEFESAAAAREAVIQTLLTLCEALSATLVHFARAVTDSTFDDVVASLTPEQRAALIYELTGSWTRPDVASHLSIKPANFETATVN
jgi:hypothetical protein